MTLFCVIEVTLSWRLDWFIIDILSISSQNMGMDVQMMPGAVLADTLVQ